jgi:hypothetical protein
LPLIVSVSVRTNALKVIISVSLVYYLYIQCFKILYWCIIKWTRGLLKTLRISRETGFISLQCYAYEDYHVNLWLSTLWLPTTSLWLVATMYMKEFENLILNCFFKVEYCHLYKYTMSIICVQYLSELSTLWLCKVHIFGSVLACVQS